MFSNWLIQSLFKTQANNSKTPNMHAILGTDLNTPSKDNLEEALFACGCFWGAEKCFWKLPGIITTAVGYAGGNTPRPTYQEVCSGKTGHTEVVRVVWDNKLIDFSDLLKLFWECHNPTQGNRQGNDHGTQYRSAIYTITRKHYNLSLASRESYQTLLANKNIGTITTEIEMNKEFHIAEDYHQQYLAKPGNRPYCSAMPTQISLLDFPGAEFKLPREIWNEYDWSIDHCVLKSNNLPISTSVNT